MEKFAITAEMNLAFSSGLDTEINKLKEKLKGLGVSIPLSFSKTNIDKQISSIESSLNKAFSVSVKLSETSIKGVYRELRAIKPAISIGLKVSDEQVKNIYRNLRLIQPIIPIGLKILDKDVKNFYNELRLINPNVKLNVTETGLDLIKAEVNKLNGLSVKISVSTRKNDVANLQGLADGVLSLNSSVSAIDVNKVNSFITSVGALGNNLKSLKTLSGKKLTFDFAVKDTKALTSLVSSVNALDAAFNKARLSGGFLRMTIDGIAISAKNLSSAINSIDVSGIQNVSTSIGNTHKVATAGANNTTKATKGATNSIAELGRQSAITLKRFGAYTLVTASFFRLSFAFRNAVSEFIDFDKQLTTIRQVTGQSIETTRQLGDEVGRLATQYGVGSQSILETSQVLAQAGFNSDQVRQALEALTKTEVAPTFDDIKNTTEGAIALMAQFKLGTNDLEGALSSINSVAAAFAVESEDITTAIQKAGGAFAAAGGNLNELQALFTSVRATTRESADTIAVGIRTITTRLQRVRTGKFLEDLGINIRASAEDVKKFAAEGKILNEGDFIGTFEAFRRINEATKNLGSQDPRFAQIAEELGGFRQINKVIPLIKEFGLSQNALNVAMQGSDSLTRDAITAQESYANQLTKVREEFLLLIREIAEDTTIRSLITDMLSLAQAGIQVAKTLKGLAPVLVALSAAGTAKFATKFFPAFKDTLLSRNSGGIIPGSGPDKDTVPAMLTKGEYVINKKATRKIGKENLDYLNSGYAKFNTGGAVGGIGGGRLAGGLLVGAAVASQTGMVDGFLKLEDSNKELATSLIGLGATILVLNSSMKALAPTIAKYNEGINKRIGNAPSSFNPDGPNRKDIEEASGFAKRTKAIDTKLATQKYIDLIGGDSVRDRKEQFSNGFNAMRSRDEAIKSREVARNNIQRLAPQARANQAELANLTQINSIVENSTNPDDKAVAKSIRRKLERLRNRSSSLNSDIVSNTETLNSSNNTIKNTRIPTVNNQREFRIGELLGQRTLADRQLKGLDDESVKNRINKRFNTPRDLERIENITRKRSLPPTPKISLRERIGSLNISEAGVARIGGGAIIGGAAGSFAGSAIRRSATNVNQASIGGAIGSASELGAAGATLGLLFGPLGAAIGGAGGGLIGAIYGASNAAKEFENSINRTKVEDISKGFTTLFEDISGGKASAGGSRGVLTSNLSSLQKIVQSSSDVGVREDALASVRNNSTNILSFTDSIAKTSNSLKSFDQKIDESTQRFISSVLGIPFSKFRENINNQIKASQEESQVAKRLSESLQEFNERVRASTSFVSAFREAELAVNRFTDNLKDFSSGSGSTRVVDQLSPRVNDLSNITNVDLVTRTISDFTSQFGQAGNILGRNAVDAARAASIIPEILQDIKNDPALDDSGDAALRFSRALEEAGVSAGTATLLGSRLEDLLGADFKDSSFFNSLERDFPKAVADVVAGLENSVNSISNAYAISTNAVQKFASDLEDLRGASNRLRDGRSSVLDIQSAFVAARSSFDNPGVQQQESLSDIERRRTSLFTGGLSVNQLSQNINRGRSNISNLDNRLNGTQDLAQRAQIVRDLELQRSAVQRSTDALNFLATSTNELSLLQSRLSQEQANRSTKRDFALDFISQNPIERSRTNRVVTASKSAAFGNTAISPDILPDVIGFLKQFENIEIANGLTGKDVQNKIINANANVLPDGFRNVGQKGKEEKSLEQQIENAFKLQTDAQNALNTILESNTTKLSQQLNKDFANFLSGLQTTLQANQIRDVEQRINDNQGKLQNLVVQRNKLGNIQSRFGENAINNASEIKQIDSVIKSSNKQDVDSALINVREAKGQTFKERQGLGNFLAPRTTVEDFNQKAGAAIQNLSPDQVDKVVGDLAKNDIGRNQEDGTVDIVKAFSVLRRSLEEISNTQSGELATAQNRKQQIIQNVGGEENFNKIAEEANEIIKLSNEFPKDASIIDLNRSINELRIKIDEDKRSIPAPIRRNSGGTVPGSGNSDTVPALLTPGEFVINKKSAQRLGMNNLLKLNSQKFANGGEVKRRKVKELEGFPKTIASNLENYGVSILSSDKITDIDPELRFQTARGSNRSFENVEGLYRSPTKEVFIRNDAGSEVLFHELGHAFDYSEGAISDSKKYMVAYRRDVSKLNKQQKERFAYFLQNGVAGQRESFAAIFDSVLRNNSTSSSIFPEATKVVQESIKGSEIRNLHDSYKEIRRLRNSATPDFGLLLEKIRESKEKISTSLVKDDLRVQKYLSQLDTAEKLYSDKSFVSRVTGKKVNNQKIESRNGGGYESALVNYKRLRAAELTDGKTLKTDRSGNNNIDPDTKQIMTLEKARKLGVYDSGFQNKRINAYKELQKYGQKFNSGGFVPGTGNTDTVPALLTPGEFVLNKQATQRVGLNTLRKVNSGTQKFNQGGVVNSQNTSIMNSESINRFNTAVNQLGIQVERMRDVFASIPTSITMTGTHKVEVNITGAQMFSALEDSVMNLVTSQINSAMNKMLKDKFPQVGQFNG
jgi:TP901 family phage tail tape measure protein